MDEKDLELISELVKKAANCQCYDVAAKLKDARELLKKKINDRWVDRVLKQVIGK